MKNSNSTVSPALAEAMQARFAYRVASRLSGGAEALQPDLSERLRFAREQALGRARHARAVAPATAGAPAVLAAGRSAALLAGGGDGWWVKLGSLLPLAALAAGLLLIQHLHDESQIATAAAIDAELLADDLPPAAYTDPGFAEFLKSPQE